MAEFQIKAVDFYTAPNFSWETMIKKFDNENKEKNFTIENGNLSTPVTVRYKLTIYRVAQLSSSMVIAGGSNLIEINEPTLEDFYDSVISNRDLLISYAEWFNSKIYDTAADPELERLSDKKMFFSSASKVTSIKPYITKLENADLYTNDNIVIETLGLDLEPIIQMVDNHPELPSIIDGIFEREEEIKREVLRKQSMDNETVRRNNYEMWKLLTQKYENGEFDEFK